MGSHYFSVRAGLTRESTSKNYQYNEENAKAEDPKSRSDTFRSGALTTVNFEDWSDEIKQEFKDNEMNGAIGQNLVFENDSVRVWQMALEPGERMPVLRHVCTYFWTAIEGGHFLQRTYDGTTYESESPDGETHFYYVAEGEFALHNLENVGNKRMSFCAVELKKESKNPLLPVKHGIQFGGKTFTCS